MFGGAADIFGAVTFGEHALQWFFLSDIADIRGQRPFIELIIDAIVSFSVARVFSVAPTIVR